MARTTLDIDPVVLRELKRRQQASGKSLGELVSELLAAELARHDRDEPRPEPAFEWNSAEMRARVDLDDKDALARALDGS